MTTRYGQYALSEPDEAYAPLVKQVMDMMGLCDDILSALEEDVTASYQTILDAILMKRHHEKEEEEEEEDGNNNNTSSHAWSEQDVLDNAQFILCQLRQYHPNIDRSPFLLHLKRQVVKANSNGNNSSSSSSKRKRKKQKATQLSQKQKLRREKKLE